MTEALTAERIEREYRELGYEKGWTFLACREEHLNDALVAIVGLNPGGGGVNDVYPYGGVWSCENNSFCEYESRLRDQVREWHRILGLGWDETLCVQFIPFRSPDLARLGQRKKAFQFARMIWTSILEISPASLFLVMGAEASWHLADLISAKLVVRNLPTGWGKVTINVWESENGRRIVQLPHPSMYKLFLRGEANAIAEASLRCAVATSC